jgi:hypothetical protein
MKGRHRANRFSINFWYLWFEMEPRLWMTPKILDMGAFASRQRGEHHER